MKCPKCGCTPEKRCVVILADGCGEGLCASAGTVPGHGTCSACLPAEPPPARRMTITRTIIQLPPTDPLKSLSDKAFHRGWSRGRPHP